MPASEAQILANRANALKHGLTGEGVALAVEDSAEVDRMFAAYQADFRPAGEMGRSLLRRAVVCMVRMERSVLQETAAINRRVEQARSEARANGEDPIEAGHRAMFDPSKEACLARKYEAAAERGYFRAMKEVRELRRESQGPDLKSEAEALRKQAAKLASSFPAVDRPASPVQAASATPPAPPKPASKPVKTVFPAWKPVFSGSVDVPITIGRAR
jgi:hypothetical protein